jgi:hypothetical protein
MGRNWFTTSVFNKTNHMMLKFGWHYLFCILYFFYKGLEMMGSDKIHTASCTYAHVLSLCYLYPLPVTWRVTNVNFQKILFSCTLLSHFVSSKRNELKIPLLFIKTVFHRALVLASCSYTKIEQYSRHRNTRSSRVTLSSGKRSVD